MSARATGGGTAFLAPRKAPSATYDGLEASILEGSLPAFRRDWMAVLLSYEQQVYNGFRNPEDADAAFVEKVRKTLDHLRQGGNVFRVLRLPRDAVISTFSGRRGCFGRFWSMSPCIDLEFKPTRSYTDEHPFLEDGEPAVICCRPRLEDVDWVSTGAYQIMEPLEEVRLLPGSPVVLEGARPVMTIPDDEF